MKEMKNYGYDFEKAKQKSTMRKELNKMPQDKRQKMMGKMREMEER